MVLLSDDNKLNTSKTWEMIADSTKKKIPLLVVTLALSSRNGGLFQISGMIISSDLRW